MMSDSCSSAEEEVGTESAKKREPSTTSWAHLLVQLVPFNAAALGPTSCCVVEAEVAKIVGLPFARRR